MVRISTFQEIKTIFNEICHRSERNVTIQRTRRMMTKNLIRFANDAMRREFDMNCMVWDGGFPVAQPFELLVLDGRPGIVFERVYGETVMKRFMQKGLPHASYLLMA